MDHHWDGFVCVLTRSGPGYAASARSGFTLLEVLVVVVVLGILPAVVVPRLMVGSVKSVKERACLRSRMIIHTNVERHHLQRGCGRSAGAPCLGFARNRDKFPQVT